MIDLSKVINENTFIISDTHFGHPRILQFETVRLEYLSDYNTDVAAECQELLYLLETTHEDEKFKNQKIYDLCKFLIPFHDDMLVEKWNEVVGENDTLFHLGDFAFHDVENISSKLNGKKILLRGNHDMKSSNHYLSCGWTEIIDSVKICMGSKIFEITPNIDKYWNGLFTKVNDKKILFSHYPIFNNNEWDVKKYGNITDMLEEIYTSFDASINFHGHTHSKSSKFHDAINVSTECCTGLRPRRISEFLDLV